MLAEAIFRYDLPDGVARLDSGRRFPLNRAHWAWSSPHQADSGKSLPLNGRISHTNPE
jgi:hypothetical protein